LHKNFKQIQILLQVHCPFRTAFLWVITQQVVARNYYLLCNKPEVCSPQRTQRTWSKTCICFKCLTRFEYYKVCNIHFHCSAAEAFVLLGCYTVTNTFSTHTHLTNFLRDN